LFKFECLITFIIKHIRPINVNAITYGYMLNKLLMQVLFYSINPGGHVLTQTPSNIKKKFEQSNFQIFMLPSELTEINLLPF
jgi:hypothetical protein